MSSKNTILSQNDALLLENLIAKHGLVVGFDQVFEELKKAKSRQEVRDLVSKLSKAGWFVRIKKGVYYIANLESRGIAALSALAIAGILADKSYVSFEGALQHYGLFDQHLRTIRSVSLEKKKARSLQNTRYEFVKTGKKYFYGFEIVRQAGEEMRVAVKEKAILDILNFKRSAYTIDLVLEKLKENREAFDARRLDELSKKQPLSAQRVLGFILDKAGIDSGGLCARLKNKKGYSKMTADSHFFNAKWRLYYHKRFK